MKYTNEKRRTHIEYGYKTFTGTIFTDAEVDEYNRIQDDINAFIDAMMPVPFHLLDMSFHKFCHVAMKDKH